MKCKNCGYEWDYKGKLKYYATCPNCLYKVNIQKSKTEEKKVNC